MQTPMVRQPELPKFLRTARASAENQQPGILREWALLAALLLVGIISHGFNMFNFPAFTYNGDEGIYTSQALAVLLEGRLTPYTYWYDHAPAGWLMIAGWMALTGGPFTFGGPIESGRLLMLVLHLAMIVLLYRVERKFGCSPAAAALGVVLFSLSPLAVFYQRLVMLDNIMMFWVLLSLDLLLDGSGRLSRVILSGVCFGIAILSKETAVFLFPVLLFVAFRERREHHGNFAVGGWLIPLAIVVSWYPLYALLKGELLPSWLVVSLFGDDRPRVSLIDTLAWQLQRGGGGAFNLDNDFWRFMRNDWLPRDPLLLIGGFVATLINLLFSLRNRALIAAWLLGGLPLLYLARGGLTYNFYVIFIIPFFCLNLAILANLVFARVPRIVAAGTVAVIVAVLGITYTVSGTAQPLYTEQPSQSGKVAIAWIKDNVDPQSMIIADDAFLPELRFGRSQGESFPNVHSHWKVGGDPEVWDGILGNDWRKVDYLIMTPGLETTFANQHQNSLALDAYRNADLITYWEADSARIELWKVDKTGTGSVETLRANSASLEQAFARDGAYVSADGAVRAESQAYAMLRSVWTNDRAAFDRAWGWTQANLLNDAGLLHAASRDGAVSEAGTTADANSDAALALLLGARLWGDQQLQEAGVGMVQAIWEHEVVTIDGTPYIAAGDWATSRAVVALNPSHFAPYAYRVFQEVDPDHDWQGVIDSGYSMLRAASTAPLGTARPAGLLPDWVGLDRATGELVPLQIPSGDSTIYGADAPRAYFRVALDQRWTGDERATKLLEGALFLRSELVRNGSIGAVYERDGAVSESFPSPTGTAGAIAALLTIDDALADRLYTELVVGDESLTSIWGSDLLAHEWSWFAAALYQDVLRPIGE
jgi:endo-1,4-beta-D-glucanase Y/4-amino-4-deoxy-L-arabinose transferase-like glycosyltransferase